MLTLYIFPLENSFPYTVIFSERFLVWCNWSMIYKIIYLLNNELYGHYFYFWGCLQAAFLHSPLRCFMLVFSAVKFAMLYPKTVIRLIVQPLTPRFGGR